jgi:hypothetical protein
MLAVAVGCQELSEPTGAAPRHVKPGPEESFEMIVETVRRGIEDVPIGFVLRDEDGHSMMTGKNEVSHELIPPSKEGEPYKAIITVGSQSHYSIQRATSDEDDEGQVEKQRIDSLAQETDETGLEVFDSELVGSSGKAKQDRRPPSSAAEKSEKTVTRQADRQERKYEFVYVDGKWTLVTPLDAETEQSIQNAFNRALEMQI